MVAVRDRKQRSEHALLPSRQRRNRAGAAGGLPGPSLRRPGCQDRPSKLSPRKRLKLREWGPDRAPLLRVTTLNQRTEEGTGAPADLGEVQSRGRGPPAAVNTTPGPDRLGQAPRWLHSARCLRMPDKRDSQSRMDCCQYGHAPWEPCVREQDERAPGDRGSQHVLLNDRTFEKVKQMVARTESGGFCVTKQH